MADLSIDLLEIVLRECTAVRPEPWYPAEYVQATGVHRDALNSAVDHLRNGGLIGLTEWVPSKGQGYVLTTAGASVLAKPRFLDQLRRGDVPVFGGEPTPAGAEERPQAADRASAIRAALTDRSWPLATLGLIAVHVVVFVVGLEMASRVDAVKRYLEFGVQDPAIDEIRHQLGALKRDDLAFREQWWRLLACCFVHAGGLALAIDMFFLYSIAAPVERLWGRGRFLALYLIAGLASSCIAIVFLPANALLMGSFGALCGVLGSMAAWALLNRPYLPPGLAAAWLRRIGTSAIFLALISLFPGVIWQGNLGGGVAGLAAAVPLTWSRFGQGPQRWLGLAGVAVVPLALLGWLDAEVMPTTEVGRAHARFWPQLLHVEKTGKTVLKGEIKPLYRKAQKDEVIPPADAARALARVAEAEAEIKQVADSLAAAPTFEDPRINRGLGFAKEYVDAWLQVCARFRHNVDAQGHVRPLAQGTIQRTDELLDERVKRVNDSVLASGK